MDKLIELYEKTNGGHTQLSNADFKEYSLLRKQEYTNKRDELLEQGYTNIHPHKDNSGDITGWSYIMPADKKDINPK